MTKGPLDGVKVLDFTWYLAGATCSKLLADMGAVVVRVESRKRVDPHRLSWVSRNNIPGVDGSPTFILWNTGKMSMALDMSHPKGIGVAKKLVKWADVMMENFTPGAIVRMGLGYDVVKELNPGIIMLSTSTLGNIGSDNPLYKEHSGAGPTGAAYSGLTYLTGWPDLGPAHSLGGSGRVYCDFITPMFSTMAIVSALDYRRRTGKGQFLDTTHMETTIENMGLAILDYQTNERVPRRMGNRDMWAAPHGAFRCRGEEWGREYCVIAVFTQEQWQALCEIIGDPELSGDKRFATPQARKANEDELEKIVEAWTLKHTPQEVMEKLQGVRVPAGVVQTVADIMDKDPQFKVQEAFVKLEHPVVGLATHWTPPFKLSSTPEELKNSPCLGEHTEYVCTELLKMSREAFEGLKAEGVFR